jgi:hypothetical protein
MNQTVVAKFDLVQTGANFGRGWIGEEVGPLKSVIVGEVEGRKIERHQCDNEALAL